MLVCVSHVKFCVVSEYHLRTKTRSRQEHLYHVEVLLGHLVHDNFRLVHAGESKDATEEGTSCIGAEGFQRHIQKQMQEVRRIDL